MDEFENAFTVSQSQLIANKCHQRVPLLFKACLSSLTNPSTTHIHDSEEVKTSVEQTILKFLDIGRQIECFFLQKRLLLSVKKPELLLTEDCHELRNEIARKDQILNKYYEKLQIWQSMVNETVANGDGHHLQKLQPMMPSQTTQMPGQPPVGPPQPGLSPQLRHTTVGQNPVNAGGPHLMRPPMGPQMTAPTEPMTPTQMMPSAQMSGPGGMLPPPPPQTNLAAGQSMMGQMAGQPSGQPMPQFMAQQSHPVQLQGPLAFLERTTSNIGLPDPRR